MVSTALRCGKEPQMGADVDSECTLALVGVDASEKKGNNLFEIAQI
jgi:hypothetical protein